MRSTLPVMMNGEIVLADIANGNTDAGDVLFLIAVIVFAVAAIGSVTTSVVSKFVSFLTNVGLALVALGFLVL